MRRGFFFTIGILLIIAAVAGLVICIGGVYAAWQVRGALAANLNSTLGLLDDTLQATNDALVVANTSLDAATKSVGDLSTTIRTTGKSVNDTLPMIDSLTKLTSIDLPKTIGTTQEALNAAKTSATMVDSTLLMLSSFPLLPLPKYNPSVPLGESLGEVAESLDPLPDSLIGMKTTLTNARNNLEDVGGQFDTIADDVTAINASLTDAKNVIGQYQGVVGTLQSQVTGTQNSLPGLVDTIAWAFTIVLVWLGLTQVGLLMQGFEMIGMGMVKRGQPVDEKEPEVASDAVAP